MVMDISLSVVTQTKWYVTRCGVRNDALQRRRIDNAAEKPPAGICDAVAMLCHYLYLS